MQKRKRQSAPECPGRVCGPIKARATWPTGFVKLRESKEWLAKPGHYKTKAAFRKTSSRDAHVGPKSATEESQFGVRAELLFFSDGHIRVRAAVSPSVVEVDEDGNADGEVSVSGPIIQGRMGVSRYGRSLLTPLLDGEFECDDEGYGAPAPIKLCVKVLQPGQSFKVEQCPFEKSQCGERDNEDSEGLLKMTTGAGDLEVTFNLPRFHSVVHYMKRTHEIPTNWRDEPEEDCDINIEQAWFC